MTKNSSGENAQLIPSMPDDALRLVELLTEAGFDRAESFVRDQVIPLAAKNQVSLVQCLYEMYDIENPGPDGEKLLTAMSKIPEGELSKLEAGEDFNDKKFTEL